MQLLNIIVRIRHEYTDNLKLRNDRHHEDEYLSRRRCLIDKGVSETIENEVKEQKWELIDMLLDTLVV